MRNDRLRIAFYIACALVLAHAMCLLVKGAMGLLGLLYR